MKEPSARTKTIIRTAAAVAFIAEGVFILAAPRYTVTAFCRKYPWGQYLVNVLLDVHWDGHI